MVHLTELNKLTPAQIATLALLEAPDKNGKTRAPIPGRIHLVKELFAIRTTDLGKRLLPDLEFEADNFGPFDETVFAALDELSDLGLVETVATTRRGEIRLTPKGAIISTDLWKRLREEVRGLLSYVKANYNHRSADSVLHEIYSAFPEMTKNSISPVAERYRPET